MQISLRSQMIAGTTAFVGATAIAMTPVAPAISIPSISTAKLGVAMAAFVNPLAEVLGTGNMILNYVLNGNYSTDALDSGLSNWGPYANLGPGLVTPTVPPVVVVPAGIGPVTNAGLTFGLLPDLSGYGPAINAVGIIPDFLGNPFPILTQVVNNQLGYITTALEAVGAVAGAAVNVLWTPVQLAFEITTLVLSGNIALIPTAIAEAVSQVVTGFQIAAGAVVNSATEIVSNVIAKATAVAGTIVAEAPLLLEAVSGQFALVANSVQNTIENVAGELAAGDIEGTWNAAVEGLLGPSGIPGTLVNLTLGAGIQVSPDIAPLTPGTLVPSTRVVVQTTGQALAGALAQTAPVTAASVRAEAAPAAAVAAEAAPAAEATAGDNSAAAEESTTAAPAASAAADDSTSSDAPKKASKAGAVRAGR